MTIAEQILAEPEYRPIGKSAVCRNRKTAIDGRISKSKERKNGDFGISANLKEKEEQAIWDIVKAMDQHTGHGNGVALAFSGGSDSLVLLDLFQRSRSHRAYLENPDYDTQPRPYIIWINSQMEYPGTLEFIMLTTRKYGLFDRLRIAKSNRTPQEQWRRTGYPMLGKLPARLWMQKNRGQGFAINCSECCRAMKITPARRLTRNLGCTLQITGQRGQQDGLIRGLRDHKDGVLFYHKSDHIWISNPLTGWTNEDIANYIQLHKLKEHPARAKGAKTIGCIYCGGGSQYTNSGFRVLRFGNPPLFKRLIIDYNIGPIILAIKYKQNLFNITQAIKDTGGLESLLNKRPWVFDFTRKNPLQDTKGP